MCLFYLNIKKLIYKITFNFLYMKKLLNFLNCCKSKPKQPYDEKDIKIVDNKEIKKILYENNIEDSDFQTFTSDKASIETSDAYKETSPYNRSSNSLSKQRKKIFIFYIKYNRK